jgi:deferrochelatase/peroxidase EfeB
MIQSEGGLMVHVHADRPETLDLLRRHIDQLARDLSSAGHDAEGFTFSDGRDQGEGRSEQSSARSVAQEPEPAASQSPTSAGEATGVDIRI